MKTNFYATILMGLLVSSFMVFSSAMADEVNWLNQYKFIGGQNVKVSHGSPGYPGSIIVDIITEEEPEIDDPAEPGEPPEPVEPADSDEEAISAEIIKRLKIEENSALTSITVCFRDYASTLPFAVNIYRLGLPTDEMTVEEDLLYGASEYMVADDECTVISFDEEIVPEGEKLLLGIVFDLEAFEDKTAAIISAVGLGLTSTLFEIDGCDTGIPDLDVDGTPLSELIDECAANAKNHGKFVSCVNKVINPLKKAGIISGSEKGQITSCAARSSLP